MHKTTLLVSVLGFSLGVSQAALAETKSYDLGSFNAISVAQGLNVDVSVGSSQAVTAEAPDGKIDRLSITVKNNTLYIRRAKKKGGWGWGNNWNSKDYSVIVSVQELYSVDGSSGADVSVEGVDSAKFSIDTSSGANVSVSGTCGTLSADASSGAGIDADDLVCESVSADVSSGAGISVHATKNFSGDASSGGRISVDGGPQNVSADKSSGGSISF